MVNSEQENFLVPLSAGSVKTIDPGIVDAIQRFEPMGFEPGAKAAEWLKLNVETGVLPLDTHLVVTDLGDHPDLIGFFVVEEMEVKVASDDLPIVEVRNRGINRASPLRAVKLVWIARAETAPEGFGEELFDEVLVKAVEARAVVVIVQPYDDDTAESLWKAHFHCKEPRPGWVFPEDEKTTFLWYPVGEADQSFG